MNETIELRKIDMNHNVPLSQMLLRYSQMIEEILLEQRMEESRSPYSLYEPIEYTMNLGGKRLRPLLMLMFYEYFSADQSSASCIAPAVVGIEMFHNFTLLHDDLMDQAPTRRGKPTVYTKWNPNVAILSGDAMMIQAFRALSGLKGEAFEWVYLEFCEMALRVCEGQQYDMEFEQRSEVSLEEYLDMIDLKTGALIASSMAIGAYLGGASSEQVDRVRRAGKLLGLAFQLMDDYLDVFAEDTRFGKRRGGDILEEKKTWLLIRGLECDRDRGNTSISEALRHDEEEKKIQNVIRAYEEYGLGDELLSEVTLLTDQAIKELESLGVSLPTQQEQLEGIVAFCRSLVSRTH